MILSVASENWEENKDRSSERPATEDWEVDCRAINAGAVPQFLLSVRHRRERTRNRVLLTTTDWARAAKVDAATRRLLKDMDSKSFGALVQLA
ncbi:MAG: hypothetical protein EOP06_13820 [Proteobacteria bacterium]|nr:MAG: hypothetical protein EOP06_13820 [Pseudomonadota bacterium]